MRIMHYCSIMVVVALACCSVSHAADVLYDGLSGSGPGSMSAQGWSYMTDPYPAPYGAPLATEGLPVSGDGILLSSTADISESAGYFSNLIPLIPPAYLPIFGPQYPPHPDVVDLDSTIGFAVKFDVQLLAEDHTLDPNRAGFSVIVLDKNARGVELGFWIDEIWAQTPSFGHSLPASGEQAPFNTAARTQYELAFQGTYYYLSAGGTPLFSGSLKDYSAYILPGNPDPYEIPDFIFFGDNTTSASADVAIYKIELVPEPATATVLLMGFAAAIARRKRSKAAVS